MLYYAVVLTFKFVVEFLACDYSNECYWAVLSYGAVRLLIFYKKYFGSNVYFFELDRFKITYLLIATSDTRFNWKDTLFYFKGVKHQQAKQVALISLLSHFGWQLGVKSFVKLQINRRMLNRMERLLAVSRVFWYINSQVMLTIFSVIYRLQFI